LQKNTIHKLLISEVIFMHIFQVLSQLQTQSNVFPSKGKTKLHKCFPKFFLIITKSTWTNTRSKNETI